MWYYPFILEPSRKGLSKHTKWSLSFVDNFNGLPHTRDIRYQAIPLLVQVDNVGGPGNDALTTRYIGS